ncbi:AAA family ATPase [Methanobrevibacter sp.]|uniref:AAA family ATPase n=1 Tax=Methanobrevibacter sp. TaxID=66852 RepID=UPI0026DF0DB8|nr:AAA family ATPase [Methanobrevibacter sp.]MDO5859104.1 AAA family ATPase [Methanobrevibacter sp.]
MWMVRAGKDAFLIDDFKQFNLVAIGWDLGDLKDKSSDEIYELFNEKYSNTRSAMQVIRFVYDIKVDDYVVTYDRENRVYQLGRITSDYYHSDKITKVDDANDNYYDIRDVEWLGDIPKDSLKKTTQRTLGAQTTVFNINENAKVDILNVFSNNEYINKIQTLTLSLQNPDCLTYENAVDFLSNVLINERNCHFHYDRRRPVYLFGKTLILFKYEDKLIAKCIFIDEFDNPETVNGITYKGYYVVDKDSIEIFNKPIGLNDIKRYVLDIRSLNKDQKIDIKYLDNINQMIKDYTADDSWDFKRNIIYFGAPGTGKSYNLNQDKDSLLKDHKDNYERVTFHPDYSYANFVGTYKPVPENNSITYKYVPGPFMRILKKAINNPSEPYLLIIEEINRANVAAVFGDVFQILDRENNESIYPIDATEDMKTYLNQDKIILPQNLFIWATMNSADQGVFPMDTAFKRRWDFKYFSIDNNENLIENTEVTLNNKEVNWNDLRKAINDELLSYKINEDKLIGPFFAFNEFMNKEIPTETFKDIFKNKIIMYLFEDAARSKRNELFSGAGKNITYSQVCDEFDKNGIEIFTDSIKEKFITDDDGE